MIIRIAIAVIGAVIVIMARRFYNLDGDQLLLFFTALTSFVLIAK